MGGLAVKHCVGLLALVSLLLGGCSDSGSPPEDPKVKLEVAMADREMMAARGNEARKEIPEFEKRIAELSREHLKLLADSGHKVSEAEYSKQLSKAATFGGGDPPNLEPVDLSVATPEQKNRLTELEQQIKEQHPLRLQQENCRAKVDWIQAGMLGIPAQLEVEQVRSLGSGVMLPTYIPKGFKLDNVDKDAGHYRLSYSGPGGANFSLFGSQTYVTDKEGGGGRWKSDKEYTCQRDQQKFILKHYGKEQTGEDRLQAMHVSTAAYSFDVRFDAVNLKPEEGVKIIESLKGR